MNQDLLTICDVNRNNSVRVDVPCTFQCAFNCFLLGESRKKNLTFFSSVGARSVFPFVRPCLACFLREQLMFFVNVACFNYSKLCKKKRKLN